MNKISHSIMRTQQRWPDLRMLWMEEEGNNANKPICSLLSLVDNSIICCKEDTGKKTLLVEMKSGGDITSGARSFNVTSTYTIIHKNKRLWKLQYLCRKFLVKWSGQWQHCHTVGGSVLHPHFIFLVTGSTDTCRKPGSSDRQHKGIRSMAPWFARLRGVSDCVARPSRMSLYSAHFCLTPLCEHSITSLTFHGILLRMLLFYANTKWFLQLI